VGGTLKKPEMRGGLALYRARFRLGATGTMLEDVNGTVRMTGDSVYVDSIAGSANGPVRLTGTMAIGNWREPTFNLTFHAQDAELLNTDRGEVHANADLKITGPFAHANVTGRVDVVHGVLYIPESSGKKLVGAGDPQLFSVVDTSVALEREIFPGQSPLFEGLVVDVELSVERGTWVRSQDANVEVYTDGPMRVSVQGDALTITGAVNADRGEYTFLSKRFQITRGSALFIGSPDLNPTIQVTAEYQVKQATTVTNVRVLVGGTVQKPRISLESDAQPPLSQSDLMSYLAFGASSGSLLQVGSTGAIAGGLKGTGVINAASSRLAGVAVGVAIDELEGDAARSLGMDVFNVTPGDIPIEQGQGAVSQFLRGTEIELGFEDPVAHVRAFGLAILGAKPSMLLDLEAGRPTEVDFINGAIPRVGAGVGVAAPFNEAVSALVHSLEQRTIDSLLGDLRVALRADRVTLRQDVPGDYAFPVTVEALGTGVGSLRDERTVDLRKQPVVALLRRGEQVVQDDTRGAFDDPAFHRMLDTYGGLAAQIVTPIFGDGRLEAIVSVHALGKPRAWSDEDTAACRRAADRVRDLL